MQREIALSQIVAISLIASRKDLDALGMKSLGLEGREAAILYLFALMNPKTASCLNDLAKKTLTLAHIDRHATSEETVTEAVRLQRSFSPCGIYVQMPILNNSLTIAILTVISTHGRPFIDTSGLELVPISA